MAVTLTAKPAAAIEMRLWAPALAAGDGIASYTLTPTTVVIESDDQIGEEIQFFVSGGTAGNVYPIAASVETSFGETLKETLYLPIFGPGNAFSQTAQNVIDFALRPVVGLSGSPTTPETNDALEWLNGMLASWRTQGADVGIALPLTTSSVMYCNDAHLLAVKNNLRVLVAEQYGRQVSPTTAVMALRGLQQIKQALLPDDRGAAEYY